MQGTMHGRPWFFAVSCWLPEAPPSLREKAHDHCDWSSHCQFTLYVWKYHTGRRPLQSDKRTLSEKEREKNSTHHSEVTSRSFSLSTCPLVWASISLSANPRMLHQQVHTEITHKTSLERDGLFRRLAQRERKKGEGYIGRCLCRLTCVDMQRLVNECNGGGN